MELTPIETIGDNDGITLLYLLILLFILPGGKMPVYILELPLSHASGSAETVV